MRVTSAFVLALSAVASTSATTLLPRDSCTTGSTQCCSSVQSVNATGVAEILGGFGLLGLPLNIGAILGDVGALIGLACSPITAVGAGGNSCSSQPVCCSNNYEGGVLATGCIPINANP